MRTRSSSLLLAGLLALGGCGSATDPDGTGATSTGSVTTPTLTPVSTSGPASGSSPAASPIPAGTLRPISPDDGWPGFGLDDANSLRVATTSSSFDRIAAGLHRSWTFNASAVTGTPAIADGVAYFGDWSGVLHAIDLTSGHENWAAEHDRPRDVIAGSPLITRTRVFVADLAGYLHAVSRSTGKPIWSVALEPGLPSAAIFSSPVEAEGRIIVGTVSMSPGIRGFRGSVVGLDAWTGSELWRVGVGYAEEGRGTGIGIWSSAAVDRDRGMAYIGTGNTNRGDAADSLGNALLAIDYRTGSVVWSYRFVDDQLDQDVDVGAAPNLFTIDGRDVVGVGCKCGDYAVVDRDTGALVWRTSLTPGGPAGGVMTTAAVDSTSVYVHSYDFTDDPGVEVVFALDRDDGSIRWQRSFDDADWSAPGHVIVKGVLFQGTANGLVAMDTATGDVLWTRDVGGQIGGGIAVAWDHLLVGYNTGWDFEPPAGGGLVALTLPWG